MRPEKKDEIQRIATMVSSSQSAAESDAVRIEGTSDIGRESVSTTAACSTIQDTLLQLGQYHSPELGKMIDNGVKEEIDRREQERIARLGAIAGAD